MSKLNIVGSLIVTAHMLFQKIEEGKINHEQAQIKARNIMREMRISYGVAVRSGSGSTDLLQGMVDRQSENAVSSDKAKLTALLKKNGGYWPFKALLFPVIGSDGKRANLRVKAKLVNVAGWKWQILDSKNKISGQVEANQRAMDEWGLLEGYEMAPAKIRRKKHKSGEFHWIGRNDCGFPEANCLTIDKGETRAYLLNPEKFNYSEEVERQSKPMQDPYLVGMQKKLEEKEQENTLEKWADIIMGKAQSAEESTEMTKKKENEAPSLEAQQKKYEALKKSKAFEGGLKGFQQAKKFATSLGLTFPKKGASADTILTTIEEYFASGGKLPEPEEKTEEKPENAKKEKTETAKEIAGESAEEKTMRITKENENLKSENTRLREEQAAFEKQFKEMAEFQKANPGKPLPGIGRASEVHFHIHQNSELAQASENARALAKELSGANPGADLLATLNAVAVGLQGVIRTLANGNGAAPSSLQEIPAPKKRGPGRPRKEKPESSDEAPAPKRGRPKKSSTKNSVSEACGETPQESVKALLEANQKGFTALELQKRRKMGAIAPVYRILNPMIAKGQLKKVNIKKGEETITRFRAP